MGEVHRLLNERGRTGLLSDPARPFERSVVEAASSYLTYEGSEIGYLYSGWAQSALPHKKLADDASWQVRTDHVSLLVEPGKRHTLTGDPVPIGVPYGSRARTHHPLLAIRSDAHEQPRNRAREKFARVAQKARD